MQWLWPAALMSLTGGLHYFASAWTARVQAKQQAGERVSGIDRFARLARFLCLFLPFAIASLVPESWLAPPHEKKLWFFWWMGLWFISVLPGVVRYGSPARRARQCNLKMGSTTMHETRPFPMSLHVALDYVFVLAGVAAPWTLGFHEQTAATLYTLLLAAFGLGLNLVTRYPGGAWKILPFRWHRYVEWAAPPAFIVVPWLFFPDAGAMPYLLSALGTGIFANATLTRPR